MYNYIKLIIQYSYATTIVCKWSVCGAVEVKHCQHRWYSVAIVNEQPFWYLWCCVDLDTFEHKLWNVLHTPEFIIIVTYAEVYIQCLTRSWLHSSSYVR